MSERTVPTFPPYVAPTHLTSAPPLAGVPAVVPAGVPTAAAPVDAHCAECDLPLLGPYCHRCGQRLAPEDDLTLGRFVRAGVHEVSGFDARLVRSLWALVRAPGRLTREFVEGHRRRWVSPLQLYLLVSAAFFLLDGWKVFLNRAEMEGQVRQAFTDGARVGREAAGASAKPDELAQLLGKGPMLTDAAVDQWITYLGFAKFGMLASTALLLWLLYRKRARGGLPHVVFSLHYHAFSYLLSIAVIPLWLGLTTLRGAAPPGWVTLLFVLPSAWYFWRGLRVAYDESPRGAAVRTVALLAVDFVINGMLAGLAFGVALVTSRL